MNRSKAVMAMIMLTFSVALSVLFSINANEKNLQNSGTVTEALPKEDSGAEVSGKNISAEETETYYLTVEEDRLCAYKVTGDEREWVDWAHIDPALMENEDLKRLREGISAESFEDLCMYFEAYTS